jgi:hypothetical protein
MRALLARRSRQSSGSATRRHMVKSSRWTTLKLLYDTSDDEVAKLVRKINKSKGLPRRRR